MNKLWGLTRKSTGILKNIFSFIFVLSVIYLFYQWGDFSVVNATVPELSVREIQQYGDSAKHYLIIGDSRINGMKGNSKVKGDDSFKNVKWIDKIGMSGSWVTKDDQWKKIKGTDKSYIVIYEMGINSVGASESQGEACAKDEINVVKKIKDLGFSEVYFCEILGVDDTLCTRNGYLCRNKAINKFNSYIMSNSESKYKVLKCNQDLNYKDGKQTDGLHFSDTDFVYKWYKYLLSLGSSATSNDIKVGGAAETIVSYAMLWDEDEKIPYVYGGPGRGKHLEECHEKGLGTDCSGFVSSVYLHFNINIVGNDAYIKSMAKSTTTDISEALPGDVCWWNGHVALYIGDNKIIHTNSSTGPPPKNLIHVTVLDEYARWMGKTTYYCRMVDESQYDLLGVGGSSEKVKEAKGKGGIATINDATGMPILSSLVGSQKMIELYGFDDLSLLEGNSLVSIKNNINNEKGDIFSTYRVAVAFIGILLLVYSMLVIISAVTDSVNNIFDISMLSIISFGRWHYLGSSDIEMGYSKPGKDPHTGLYNITFKMLMIRAGVIATMGILFVAGVPFKIIMWVLWR